MKRYMDHKNSIKKTQAQNEWRPFKEGQIRKTNILFSVEQEDEETQQLLLGVEHLVLRMTESPELPLYCMSWRMFIRWKTEKNLEKEMETPGRRKLLSPQSGGSKAPKVQKKNRHNDGTTC